MKFEFKNYSMVVVVTNQFLCVLIVNYFKINCSKVSSKLQLFQSLRMQLCTTYNFFVASFLSCKTH